MRRRARVRAGLWPRVASALAWRSEQRYMDGPASSRRPTRWCARGTVGPTHLAVCARASENGRRSTAGPVPRRHQTKRHVHAPADLTLRTACVPASPLAPLPMVHRWWRRRCHSVLRPARRARLRTTCAAARAVTRTRARLHVSEFGRSRHHHPTTRSALARVGIRNPATRRAYASAPRQPRGLRSAQHQRATTSRWGVRWRVGTRRTVGARARAKQPLRRKRRVTCAHALAATRGRVRPRALGRVQRPPPRRRRSAGGHAGILASAWSDA